MTVTVVVVNWNSGLLLQECLTKLSEQTVVPQRVIVVDNASSDGSASCSVQFPQVSLIKMPENCGFAVGNNTALARCKTEFVALLNPDAFPEPNWLECLLIAASAHPEISAFGSRQLCQNTPDILDGIGDVYHCSGLVWRNRFGARQQPSDLICKEIFSPCAAAALYRREALVDVGGFDNDYFCYVEDVDLGFRMRLVGHKAVYVADAIVYHVGSATTGGQHSDFAVYHGHRNIVWTYVKNMPGILFWVFLPLHLILNLVCLFWFSTQGQADVIFRAKRDAIMGIPAMWRKRRIIQSNRVAMYRGVFSVMSKCLFR